MKIALATIGSDGDLMPFRWLALALAERGASVRVLSHPHFASSFENDPVTFVPTGPKLDLAHLDSVRERLATTRSPGAMGRLVVREVTLFSPRHHYEDCLRAIADCDVVVSHHLYFVAQEAAETRGVPWASVVLMPNMIENDLHPPTHELPFSDNRVANRVWWRIANALLASPSREIRETLRALSGRERTVSFFGGFSPTLNLLAASPAVSSLPQNLEGSFEVTGAWLPPTGDAGRLPASVREFLASGSPPVLVSLGSAGYRAEGKTMRTVLDAIRVVGCRALVFAGPEAALSELTADAAVRFIGFVPYQDLLPEVAALVHHGGAGTTALACRSGRPSVLVPHFGDHHYWANALSERGAAPPALSRRSLTSRRLAKAIHQVLTGSRHRDAAERISRQMRNEEGAQRAAECVLRWGPRPTSGCK